MSRSGGGGGKAGVEKGFGKGARVRGRGREGLLGEAKGRKGSVRVQGGKVRPPGSKRVGADRPKPFHWAPRERARGERGGKGEGGRETLSCGFAGHTELH